MELPVSCKSNYLYKKIGEGGLLLHAFLLKHRGAMAESLLVSQVKVVEKEEKK